MSTALLTDLVIFVLSLWVGFEVISKVPATLHTPLMSAANSIHGIVLVGAMLIAATTNSWIGYVIAFLAAVFASANVVGGYVVTGRMLKMFRKRPTAPAAAPAQPAPAQPASAQPAVARDGSRHERVQLRQPADLRAGCVVLCARPAPDEQPGERAAWQPVLHGGMAIAIATTLALIAHAGVITATGWTVMLVGALIGGGVGLYAARTVQMTAMPQLVSMFNAVGGGAAALVAIHDYIRVASAVVGPAESTTITTLLDVIIGSVTFSGSIIAASNSKA